MNRPNNIFRSGCLPFYMLVFCLITMSGCGYHNPYQRETVSDQGIQQRIHTSIWPNRTNETGIEALFHRDINTWFKKTSLITLATKPDQADMILEGEITNVNTPGLSYGQYDEAIESRIILTINCSLRRKRDNAIMWQEPRLMLDDTYHIDASADKTRYNKQKALARISQDLAELVYLNTLATQEN